MAGTQPIPDRRRGFDRFAERATEIVTRGAFFGVSVVIVLAWLPTIFLIHDVNTWQLVINTATSVLAFLLVALLQNSERRNDRATHEKVDRIACALAALLDARGDDDRELAQAARELRESAGLQERM